MLGRFNRLMRDLYEGGTKRNCFEPWEIDLLMDIADCHLEPQRALAILQRYQKAVQRQLDLGVLPPLRLSEYLRRNQPLNAEHAPVTHSG